MARRLALLIGNTVFDYKEDFPDLRTPANDVQELARVLQDYGDFEVFKTLIDQNSAVINEAIEDLFNKAERDDLVLLYFSGHGYRGRTGNYYLVAKNSQSGRMRTTSVPAFLIHDVMKSSRSRRRVIILDCCFSGAFTENGKTGRAEPLSIVELKGEAEAILASSDIVQYSFFPEEGPHSLFTRYLLEGIETGQADQNKDGQVSIDELFEYIDEKVRYTRPEHPPKKQVAIRESEIVIAKNPKISTPPEDLLSVPLVYRTIDLNFPIDVRNEKDFYGRKVALNLIERKILTGSNRLVIIMGERRIGKSSLQTVSAKRVATQSGGRIVPLDLPPARNIRSLNDYAKEMLQCLCSYLGKSLQETGLMNRNGQFQLLSAGHFKDAVLWLLEKAPQVTFLLCIDELDTILLESARVEAGPILGLTDYIVETANLPIVLSITMSRLSDAESNSFGSLNTSKAEVIELGPFSPHEMADMVKGILEDQVVLTDLAMARLFHLSGGHPYITKLLLDRLLKRYWSEGTTLAVTPAMIEQVVPEAVDDPRARPALANIYKVHFNREEQQLMLLLAERLKAGQTGVAGYELQVLGPAFQKAVKALARRGYLLRDAQDGYDFRIEFLGWWIVNWEDYEEEQERLGLEEVHQKFDIDIEINELTRQVRVRGKFVDLSPQEYQALVCLARQAGHLVLKDQLAQALWPEAKGDISDAAIDAAIYRLRGKLGDEARQPRYIVRVAGQGFILYRAALIARS